MDLRETFGTESPLIGMVHLPALPGAPEYEGNRQTLRGQALADALALSESGFDGLMVENFGDRPYYPDRVPRHVVAEMTATVRELAIALEKPFGVNILRNDAQSALAVAAATGGSFVRVNIHTGGRETDQGRLDGQAHETLRLRERLDEDVAIMADVDVKHSGAVGDRPVGELTRETIDRGLADAVIVSGPATGSPADDETVRSVLDARDDASRRVPVLAGSGVTPENVGELLSVLDGAIVGTAIKQGGVTTNPVDEDRATELVRAARG